MKLKEKKSKHEEGNLHSEVTGTCKGPGEKAVKKHYFLTCEGCKSQAKILGLVQVPLGVLRDCLWNK